MPNNTRHTPALHVYLKENGLEYSEQTVRDYWAQYKRDWQNRKRKEQRHFTVFWTRKELTLLENAAQSHSLKITSLIKQTSLAYLQQRFIQPQSEALTEIRQALMLMLSTIINSLDEERLSPLKADELLKKIEGLEQAILAQLESPKLQP